MFARKTSTDSEELEHFIFYNSAQTKENSVVAELIQLNEIVQLIITAKLKMLGHFQIFL